MRGFVPTRPVRPGLMLTDEARQAAGAMFAPRGRAPSTTKLVISAIASLAMATLPRWARRMYGLPGLPPTDFAATLALQGLRLATDMRRDGPAPPAIERARQLIRERHHVSV